MEFRPSNQESLLSRLTEIVESNLENKQFGVSELALELGMSRSNLHRKIKSITNLTVSQFIRRIRLKKALELLQESTLTITEVAIECGFHSLAYFTKCFNDYYGAPPSKYRNVEVSSDFLYISGKPQNHKISIPSRAIQLLMIIPFFIIAAIALVLVFHKPAISRSPALEKTIALLLLPDPKTDGEYAYVVDDIINKIRHQLSLVGDLEVVSRTLVEGFMNAGKSMKEIGKELNVNYILEGKTQYIQGSTWISFKLIDIFNNQILWLEPFRLDYAIDTRFEIEEQVTQAVTSELKTKLTVKDKEDITRNLTDNIAAYNLFMIGNDFMKIHKQSLNVNRSHEAVGKAKEMFEKAIALDSTFAEAYTSLGSIYINHMYKMASDGDFEEARNILDSGLVVLNKALFYDPKNAIALQKKAEYYVKIGASQEAEQLYKELLNLEKFSYEYYDNDIMQFPEIKDYYKVIDSYQKYLKTKPEEILVSNYMLRKMEAVFRETGFHELEKQMMGNILEYADDSSRYCRYMISFEMYQEKFDSALVYALEGNRLNPDPMFTDLIALNYAYLQQYDSALNYIALVSDSTVRTGPVMRPGYIPGYIYLMNGCETEANFHFKKEIIRRVKEIEYARSQARQRESHLYLAATHLALGDEGKALEYLMDLKTLRSIDYGHIIMMTRWPGFESIRNTPEYLDVLNDLQNKYLNQHQRIEMLIDNSDLDPSLN